MAFQAVPNAAQVVIEYTGQAVTAQSTVGAFKAGGYNLSDLTALAVAVDAAVVAEWLPIQSQDWLYARTIVRGLAFENDEEVENDDGAGAGLVASKGLPGNVTVSIKRASTLTGRSARGRLYWIGLPSAALDSNENEVLQAEVDLVETAVDELRQAIDATVWSAAIISRFTGGVARDEGMTFSWSSSVAVNRNVDSMRKRLLT